MKWINIAAGWKNDDGSISVKLEQPLRDGQIIRLKPNQFKQPHTRQPDYRFAVTEEYYDSVEHQIFREDAPKGQFTKQAKQALTSQEVADNIPF